MSLHCLLALIPGALVVIFLQLLITIGPYKKEIELINILDRAMICK
jgi:hypothetical protein